MPYISPLLSSATRKLILESDAPTYPEYDHYPVPSVHSSGVQTEQWPFPFALIALFISPFYEEEEKNPACPHGATVLILLFTVQSCAHLTSSELAAIISNKLSPGSQKGSIS
jgi:hypothetical protein